MVFTCNWVPFPATRDLQSLMAGNGTSWETKTISFSSHQWLQTDTHFQHSQLYVVNILALCLENSCSAPEFHQSRLQCFFLSKTTFGNWWRIFWQCMLRTHSCFQRLRKDLGSKKTNNFAMKCVARIFIFRKTYKSWWAFSCYCVLQVSVLCGLH